MKKNNNESDPKVPFLPIGMCIGLSIGLAVGLALDNLGVGMCLGMGIGLCFGSAVDAANAKKSKDVQAEEIAEKMPTEE